MRETSWPPRPPPVPAVILYRAYPVMGNPPQWVCLCMLSYIWLFVNPWTVAHQALLSMGFPRQEYWSGLPFPSPVHESEKWKWSRSVVSDSQRPHGLQPNRLLRPWDFPSKSTGVGCHFLLPPSLTLPYPRGSSLPRDQTFGSCIGRWILYHWATGKQPLHPQPHKPLDLVKKQIVIPL